MQPEWIENADELRQYCERVGKGPVAVDTESDHFHAYQAQVCLIQVATRESAALIDPLAMSADDMAPLFELFADPEVTKVFHSGRNDIIEIDRDYGVGINNLFDTQIAARFLNYERSSLNWMLEELLGVDTGGQFQRYDWTTRPLPDRVIRYAADDVLHLLELQERFADELVAQGWHEEFCQQCEFVAQTVEHEAKEFDPEGWRKLKKISGLDDRGRAALHALFQWRHTLCTELNQSAVTVFPNAALVRLAKMRPTTKAKLERVSRIPKRLKEEFAEAVIEVVTVSLDAEIPDEEVPREEYRPRPSEAERRRYNALRKWRNQRAGELQIPSQFIATNAVASEIAAKNPTAIAELAEVPAILEWHCQMLGEEILDVVAKAS